MASRESPDSAEAHMSLHQLERPDTASEETPLINDVASQSRSERSTVAPLAGDEEAPTPSTVADEDSVTTESDRPWPATFERSISLLAGPTMDPKSVAKYTKSPKPTPYRRGAKGLRGLQRGYRTPDPHKGALLTSPGTPGGIRFYFQQGLTRIKSLDFSSSRQQPSNDVVEQRMQAQEQRALEAQAYRAKILQKTGSAKLTKAKPGQANMDEEALMLSPGYNREKASERHRKSQKKNDDLEHKATLSQCIFNMANILMGVGMLGLPYVFKSAGWAGGFLVTIGFGFVTWRTSILIGRELNGDPRPGHLFEDSPYKSPLTPGSCEAARMRKPITSFPDIARESFGENGCIVLSSILYFELFSCLCIFFVTLGDHLHTLFPSVTMTQHMIIVAIVLTVPTALLRTPKLLSYLSAVGTFATVAVVLSVFLSAAFEGDISEQVAIQRNQVIDSGKYHIIWNTSGLPLALGLIAYTFSGHAIVPSIYSSMQRPQEFENMIHSTFLVVVACCLVVAVSGYYMFGTVVDDQITISLTLASTNADFAMKMLTWLMIMTAFSKFTLTMFPLALGIEEIVAPFVPNEQVMEAASSLIKLILIVLSLFVAIFVPSFSFLCSLVGLICTMIVSAIFPAAAHLKMFYPKLSLGEKMLDWVFVLGGSFVAVVGTIATLHM